MNTTKEHTDKEYLKELSAKIVALEASLTDGLEKLTSEEARERDAELKELYSERAKIRAEKLLKENRERADELEAKIADGYELTYKENWELEELQAERAELAGTFFELTYEAQAKRNDEDAFDTGTFIYRYQITSDLIEEDDIANFIFNHHYEPNQIRSAYDCTGRGFVSSTDYYLHRYYDSEKTDTFRRVIVEEHWSVDI